MLLLILAEITIFQWFGKFTWSKALTVVTVLGGIASTITPFLDPGQFRIALFLFISVSLYLQNLGHKQQITTLSQKISSSRSIPTLPTAILSETSSSTTP